MKKMQILRKKVIFLSTYVRNKALYIEAMIGAAARFCGKKNFAFKKAPRNKKIGRS